MGDNGGQGRPVVIDERALLSVATFLTDDKVNAMLEENLPKHLPPLKSWLLDALKVRPEHRWSAQRLIKGHSLFLETQATQRPSGDVTKQLLEDVRNIATNVHRLADDVNGGFQRVQLSLEAMTKKLDDIAVAQSDLGLVIRQAATDSGANHVELKKCLSDLGASMMATVKAAPPIEGMGASELQSLIKSVVSTSLKAVSSGLTEDLKSFVTETVVKCSESAEKTEVTEQLKQIMETLSSMRDRRSQCRGGIERGPSGPAPGQRFSRLAPHRSSDHSDEREVRYVLAGDDNHVPCGAEERIQQGEERLYHEVPTFFRVSGNEESDEIRPQGQRVRVRSREEVGEARGADPRYDAQAGRRCCCCLWRATAYPCAAWWHVDAGDRRQHDRRDRQYRRGEARL